MKVALLKWNAIHAGVMLYISNLSHKNLTYLLKKDPHVILLKNTKHSLKTLNSSLPA